MNAIVKPKTGSDFFGNGGMPVGISIHEAHLPIVDQITASARPPQRFVRQTLEIETLEAKAFNARAKAKVLVSQFASHLSDATRKRLFLTLDRLHEIDEWEEGDKPLLESSFRTFLRAIVYLHPKVWPSIGMSTGGYIFATWGDATDRINVQFLDSDWAKWVLSFRDEKYQIIRNAGTAPALELFHFIAPYNPEHWFGKIR